MHSFPVISEVLRLDLVWLGSIWSTINQYSVTEYVGDESCTKFASLTGSLADCPRWLREEGTGRGP